MAAAISSIAKKLPKMAQKLKIPKDSSTAKTIVNMDQLPEKSDSSGPFKTIFNTIKSYRIYVAVHVVVIVFIILLLVGGSLIVHYIDTTGAKVAGGIMIASSIIMMIPSSYMIIVALIQGTIFHFLS